MIGVTWKAEGSGTVVESRPTTAEYCYLTLPNDFSNTAHNNTLFAGIKGGGGCESLLIRGSCLCPSPSPSPSP